MTGTGAESGVGAWRAPECPYTIDYSARVLDDIRLAVVDAFFSLPRGGAEIGGILLGKFLNGKISILDHEALDCEHAMGPSFNLSPRDQSRLAEMVAKAQEGAGGMRPVGWYHSHTRSEIFLSDADQDIHKRFFPEPWQIALVLKPHIFDPTRGGFFFREADGSIRGSASYQEFVLDTLPIRPVPSGAAPAMPPAPRPLHSGAEPQGPVITLEPERAHDVAPHGPAPPELAVEPAKSAEPPAEPDDLPAFLQIKQEREWRGLRIVVGLAAAIALCAAGYETRQTWLPVVQAKTAPLMAKLRPALPKKPAPHLALS